MSPRVEQSEALLNLMQRFNEACNCISDVAFREKAFKQVPLHAACYHAVRERFELPSQLAVRAIAKVLESYRTDKSVCHTFGPYSASTCLQAALAA